MKQLRSLCFEELWAHIEGPWASDYDFPSEQSHPFNAITLRLLL